MLIAGLDEAGRGPVIGPLVIGCVIMNEEDLYFLDEWGIDDSKRLTHQKRMELSIKIKEKCLSWQTLVISPEQINSFHYNNNLSLNQIEEMHFAELLNNINPQPDKIYLDACDTVEERFGNSIKSHLNFKPKQIISKHKGDSLFKIVGASSILAKLERDNILQSYKEIYGNCGSGYPSDKYTRTFLTEYYIKNKKFPNITRTWWKTAINIEKEIKEQKSQKTLIGFF